MSTGNSTAPSPFSLRRQLEIVDTATDQAFDRILAIAADLFETPRAAILLHEGNAHWTKLRGHRLARETVPNACSFTQYTMTAAEVFCVENAMDSRFHDHPRVVGAPFVRFYCGAPLIDADGNRVGALGVMDKKPHAAPTEKQRRLLCHFAAEVMTHIQSRTQQYIGDRLRASEARLHRSETQMGQAQRLAEVGSGEVDFATGELFWSDQMFRIFGLPFGAPVPNAAEIVSKLVHPDDRERIADNHRRLMLGEVVPRCDYRIVRPDGEERILTRFGEVLFDDAGKPLRHLVAVQDVTDRRKAEKARDEYLQQLHHAQRLDALGTLAGGIAHDLNNTLVPILALAKLMRAEAIDEDMRRNLGVIQSAGERARDLVRQVLAFSRKNPAARGEVDLSAVVSDALHMVRAGIGPHIRVRENLPPAAPVFADSGQLHQVVINLVTNAVQAIGDRPGTVSVTLEEAPGDAASFRLTVADDGHGMDERTLSRMFEPFFTTREIGVGTGLGLSIVHGIVTGHGGAIAAESSPGEGTRFTIDLPSHEHRDAAASTDASAGPDSAQASAVVMIPALAMALTSSNSRRRVWASVTR